VLQALTCPGAAEALPGQGEGVLMMMLPPASIEGVETAGSATGGKGCQSIKTEMG